MTRLQAKGNPMKISFIITYLQWFAGYCFV